MRNSNSPPSNVNQNRSMAPGMIIPELYYANLGAAVDWLCKAFGFKERLRIGNHRSQLVYGGASLIAFTRGNSAETDPQKFAELSPIKDEVTHVVMLRVENVDRHFEKARLNGARILSSPTDYPYGERQYSAQDIGGHRWTFSQTIADVNPEIWGGKLIAHK